jgi:hypothetical protein
MLLTIIVYPFSFSFSLYKMSVLVLDARTWLLEKPTALNSTFVQYYMKSLQCVPRLFSKTHSLAMHFMDRLSIPSAI